jgi:hypothetical protein
MENKTKRNDFIMLVMDNLFRHQLDGPVDPLWMVKIFFGDDKHIVIIFAFLHFEAFFFHL